VAGTNEHVAWGRCATINQDDRLRSKPGSVPTYCRGMPRGKRMGLHHLRTLRQELRSSTSEAKLLTEKVLMPLRRSLNPTTSVRTGGNYAGKKKETSPKRARERRDSRGLCSKECRSTGQRHSRRAMGTCNPDERKKKKKTLGKSNDMDPFMFHKTLREKKQKGRAKGGASPGF